MPAAQPAPVTSASTPPVVTTTTAAFPTTTVGTDTGDVSGFEVVEAPLGSDVLLLALADDSSLRSRGLMGVRDLGELDGMLFSWGGDEVNSRFTMRNTLIPLTIVFFDGDGAFVSTTEMVPCETEECPTYGAARSYSYAIEFPAGTPVSTGDRLGVEDLG